MLKKVTRPPFAPAWRLLAIAVSTSKVGTPDARQEVALEILVGDWRPRGGKSIERQLRDRVRRLRFRISQQRPVVISPVAIDRLLVRESASFNLEEARDRLTWVSLDLADRDREILRLTCAGWTQDSISGELGMAQQRVSEHKQRIVGYVRDRLDELFGKV